MSIVHATARLCRAGTAQALALLCEAAGMARWNLGLWNTREVSRGLLSGDSLFRGGTGFVRVHADAARGSVDYRVGADVQALVPRIQARVQPGHELGYPDGTCVVTLLAWRTAEMDEARWQQLKATHEVEIDLIRDQLESAPSGGNAA